MRPRPSLILQRLRWMYQRRESSSSHSTTRPLQLFINEGWRLRAALKFKKDFFLFHSGRESVQIQTKRVFFVRRLLLKTYFLNARAFVPERWWFLAAALWSACVHLQFTYSLNGNWLIWHSGWSFSPHIVVSHIHLVKIPYRMLGKKREMIWQMFGPSHSERTGQTYTATVEPVADTLRLPVGVSAPQGELLCGTLVNNS